MNKYNNFTVEETNLLGIYMTGSKEGFVVAMNAALWRVRLIPQIVTAF